MFTVETHQEIDSVCASLRGLAPALAAYQAIDLLQRLRDERMNDARTFIILLDSLRAIRALVEEGSGRACPPEMALDQFVEQYIRQLQAVQKEAAK